MGLLILKKQERVLNARKASRDGKEMGDGEDVTTHFRELSKQ